MFFENRTQAGRKLAEALSKRKKIENGVVLGLPRGGVPVALEVARILHLELDVFVVRKVGAPYNEEFAMGAVAQDGGLFLDKNTLAMLRLSEQDLKPLIEKKKREVEERIKKFRGGRPPLVLKEKTVILVDDGVATGSTMKAAIQVLKNQPIHSLIVAVPVGPPSTIAELRSLADEVICLYEDINFMAVGQYYADFTQVEDDEVAVMMKEFSKDDFPPKK